MYTPAGFEKLFETLGEPIIDPQAGPTKRLDLARLREAVLAYGLEIPDRPVRASPPGRDGPSVTWVQLF